MPNFTTDHLAAAAAALWPDKLLPALLLLIDV
jgi:hypothetical protein